MFCYHFPIDTFECVDGTAGYFVSRVAVTPTRVETVDDAVAELQQRGVELRVLPSLWALRDSVVESTLQFSIIRWRNVAPRHSDVQPL